MIKKINSKEIKQVKGAGLLEFIVETIMDSEPIPPRTGKALKHMQHMHWS